MYDDVTLCTDNQGSRAPWAWPRLSLPGETKQLMDSFSSTNYYLTNDLVCRYSVKPKKKSHARTLMYVYTHSHTHTHTQVQLHCSKWALFIYIYI